MPSVLLHVLRADRNELTETPDIEKAWNELQAQKNSACSVADYWGCLIEACLCEAPEDVCHGNLGIIVGDATSTAGTTDPRQIRMRRS